MPYAPGIQDIRGQILAQGITGAADAITENLQKAQRIKEKDAMMAGVLNRALAVGAYGNDPADRAKIAADYLAANHAKKIQIGTDAQLALEQHAKEQAKRPYMPKPEELNFMDERATAARGKLVFDANGPRVIPVESDQEIATRQREADVTIGLKKSQTKENLARAKALGHTKADWQPSFEQKAEMAALGKIWANDSSGAGQWRSVTEDNKPGKPGDEITDGQGNVLGVWTSAGKPYWDKTVKYFVGGNDPKEALINPRTGQEIKPRVAPAPQPAAGAAAGANGKVLVIAPDGRRGWIPASQLDAATKAGYRRGN